MEKRVLVVEDSAPNRALLHDLLSRVFVCVVDSAEDGEGAVSMVKENPPDLVLMDVGLPGMDGTEATRVLKSDPTTRAIPVLALTGYSSDEDERRLLDSGFDGFLPKPFDVPQLLRTLSRHLTVRPDIRI
ncbi:MAG: response regulator [Thermodesulfobacteriota bacterium]